MSENKRKKVLLIVNPCAGRTKSRAGTFEIVDKFSKNDYEFTVRTTACQGDATNIVKKELDKHDMVVCCGGDGTLNETVNGVMDMPRRVPIGYIPSGSTNDLATTLGIPKDIKEATDLIMSGQLNDYDVGLFNNRYFTYVASFGAFTRVSYSTPQSIKNALGHTAYVLESINELSQIRKEYIRIEVDGQVIEDDFIFGAISNSTSVGGILTLDPKQVDMGDGMFELLLVRAPKSLLELSEGLQAIQSQRYNDCKMITFLSARKLKIYADPRMPWTLDGEREDGHETVEVENLHRAIRLIQRRNTYA